MPGLDGALVAYKEYRNPADGRLYKNWRINCTHGAHCQKSRGVTDTFTRDHGAIEPLAFLHAWRIMHYDASVAPTHPRANPSKLETARIAVDRKEELERIVALAGL